MKNPPRTPLALAVLELLHEHPMHPYEMQQCIRERGLNQVIKLKPASLYSTVDRLTAADLIEPVETSREGRRPERTVYAITEAGLDDLQYWLRDVLLEPAQEYPWFGAALSFVAMIPPQELAKILEFRAVSLEAKVAATDSVLRGVHQIGLPRLFAVESEYLQAMRRAEIEWVRGIIEDIRSGSLEWPTEFLAALEEPS